MPCEHDPTSSKKPYKTRTVEKHLYIKICYELQKWKTSANRRRCQCIQHISVSAGRAVDVQKGVFHLTLTSDVVDPFPLAAFLSLLVFQQLRQFVLTPPPSQCVVVLCIADTSSYPHKEVYIFTCLSVNGIPKKTNSLYEILRNCWT